MRAIVLTLILALFGATDCLLAATYYVSPTGSDEASGQSELEAWATFNRAWKDLYPGDQLVVLDGTYYQTLLPNQRNGEAGKPIVVRAKNDGKVVLDGQRERVPLQLGSYLGGGPVSDYFVVEGIVARNSSLGTCVVFGDHNVLRRVSCYNANTDKNVHVVTITGKHNLVEDCVASGTGRKMIFTWGGRRNTIRRSFARWQRFDSREYCDQWPWGENFEFYNSSDSIMENVISYGSGVFAAIGILGNINSANGDTPFSRNNKILGGISVHNGVFSDGTVQRWGSNRPQPSCGVLVSRISEWARLRRGFGIMIWGADAEVANSEFRDIFSWENAGLGFGLVKNDPASTSIGNVIDHATILKNGVDGIAPDGGRNTDVVLEDLQNGQIAVFNSRINNAYEASSKEHVPNSHTGVGARLDFEYLDGVRMDGGNGGPKRPLWPWPMQNRIVEEIGIDVTGEITEILRAEGVPTGKSVPAPTISPMPPHPVTNLKPGMVEVWHLNPVTVTLSTSEPDAVIRYTTDGSEPTSTSQRYTDALPLTVTTLLKAKVFVNGEESHSRSAYYRIDRQKTNEPPQVEANVLPFVSKYAEFVLPDSEIGLYGLAEDYTFPNPPGKLTVSWEVLAAPAGAEVLFADPSHPRTSATVSHAGTYLLRLTASDGQMVAFDDVTVVVWPTDLAGVIHEIPGRIEAENYKAGGEGVGFHNTFGYGDVLYRSKPVSPVDTSNAWNQGFGYAVYLAPGEWTAYDVEILYPAVYTLGVQVAGTVEGGILHLELNGRNISGPVQIPSVPGGTVFKTLSINTPELPAGRHELRLVVDEASAWGERTTALINYIELELKRPEDFMPSVASISGPSEVGKHEKFEITFDVMNTKAKNYQLPYDPTPPNGVDLTYERHQGISVDALFTPDNWQTVYRQPAFYYHFFEDGGQKRSWDGHWHEWYYPTGTSAWKVRFSPNQVGTWQYKLAVVDAGGSSESEVYSFTVIPSESKGFVRVSKKDPRYFEFEDGTLFLGPGLQAGGRRDDPVMNNEPDLIEFDRNEIRLIRNWISAMYGAAWPEWIGGRNLYDGYLPRPGTQPFHDPVQNRDVMALHIEYPEDWFDACRFQFWDDSEAVKPNTTYKLSIQYWGEEIGGPRVPAHPDFGLVAKIAESGNLKCYEPGTGDVVTNYGGATPGWRTLEGIWYSGERNFLPKVYVGLENVTHGKAFVRSISMREVLGNGQLGPEILQQPSMEYELYFPELSLYAMDKYLELAERSGMYLKLVLMDKNDKIYHKLDDDGTFVINGEQDNLDGFYGLGRGMNKTRWLQQAWWRYVQARWGYSPNIHSWELTNEGDPFLKEHWEMTDELGKFMHCRVFGERVGSGDGSMCQIAHPNRHLVTTSFWHSFPGYTSQTGDGFWGNPKYPNVDYADLHAYISTSEAPLEERSAMEADAAYYHLWHSEKYGGWKFKFPIVRGEAGMDQATNHGQTVAGLLSDREGTWFHNYLWSSLHSGALYEIYWWAFPHVYSDGEYDHRPVSLALHNFISGIPLNNGHYQDVAAVASNPDLRVVGQKDLANGNAHLWIQNKNHTWKKVVDGVQIKPAGGIVRIPGLAPARSYTLEWWDTRKTTGQVISTQAIETASDGILEVEVRALETDVALKIIDNGSRRGRSKPKTDSRPLGVPTARQL